MCNPTWQDLQLASCPTHKCEIHSHKTRARLLDIRDARSGLFDRLRIDYLVSFGTTISAATMAHMLGAVTSRPTCSTPVAHGDMHQRQTTRVGMRALGSKKSSAACGDTWRCMALPKWVYLGHIRVPACTAVTVDRAAFPPRCNIWACVVCVSNNTPNSQIVCDCFWRYATV
jgi:hypothetical protein